MPEVKNIANISGEQIVKIGSQDMNDEVWLTPAKPPPTMIKSNIRSKPKSRRKDNTFQRLNYHKEIRKQEIEIRKQEIEVRKQRAEVSNQKSGAQRAETKGQPSPIPNGATTER